MGGSGSGYRTSKALTVEDCLVLDVGGLVRQAREHDWGSFPWYWRRGEEKPHAYINCDLEDWEEDIPRRLVLRYTLTPRNGEPEAVEEAVRLEPSTLPTGGRKVYAVCPLVIGGRPCLRRVVKLYFPPGARFFGCRSCYRLSYRSCQESDKRRNAFLRNPAAVLLALQGGRELKFHELKALMDLDI